jgi:hypothetical protein
VVSTHDHSVVPGKDGQLIEAGDEVPSGGDVAGDEDAKSQDGEGVHRIGGCAISWAFRWARRGELTVLARDSGSRQLWKLKRRES